MRWLERAVGRGRGKGSDDEVRLAVLLAYFDLYGVMGGNNRAFIH
jgi:hypothetical protein